MTTLIFEDDLEIEADNVRISGDGEEIVIKFDGKFDITDNTKDAFVVLAINKYLRNEDVKISIPESDAEITGKIAVDIKDNGKFISYNGEISHQIQRSTVKVDIMFQ